MGKLDTTKYSEEDLTILRLVYPHINGNFTLQNVNNLRLVHAPGEYGDIYSLYENEIMWMNTSPISILDHASILTKAKGSCIFTGLGLGLCTILASINTAITDITIVENNLDVINIWQQRVARNLRDDLKYSIIIEDANTYKPLRHYDFGYFDHSNYLIPQEILNNYNATVKVEWYKEIIEVQNRLCQ
jgi:hypothetical protein